MKDDIRKKTCIVIRKNGEYLGGKVYGMNELRWYDSPYSAWKTRDKDKAKRVANATGGIMVLFNPIVNQERVL